MLEGGEPVVARFPSHPLSLRVLLVTLLCLGRLPRFSRFPPESLSLQSPKRSQTEPQLSLQSPEITPVEAFVLLCSVAILLLESKDFKVGVIEL